MKLMRGFSPIAETRAHVLANEVPDGDMPLLANIINEFLIHLGPFN